MIPQTNATAFPLCSISSSHSSLFLNVTQSAEGMMTTEGPAPTFPENLGTPAFLDKLLTRAGHPQKKQHREKRSWLAENPEKYCLEKKCLVVCVISEYQPKGLLIWNNKCSSKKVITFSSECGGQTCQIPGKELIVLNDLAKGKCWKDGQWTESDPTTSAPPLTTTLQPTTFQATRTQITELTTTQQVTTEAQTTLQQSLSTKTTEQSRTTSKTAVKPKCVEPERNLWVLLWRALNPWVKIVEILAGVVKSRPCK